MASTQSRQSSAAGPRVVDAGLPGSGLLAHAVLQKLEDALPPYRLSGIYKRSGVTLAVSTLAGWTSAETKALKPIARRILQQALRCYLLQTDDTRERP